MTPSPYLCVFLMTCFGELLKTDVCPPNCKCYTAPKDGFDAKTEAYSFDCRDIPERSNFINFKDRSINTMAIRNVQLFPLHKDYFNGYSINNLLFADRFSISPEAIPDIFSGLKKNDLKVITFLNIDFEQIDNRLDFNIFKSFNNIKAIHLESGNLRKIDSNFDSIPAESMLIANFEALRLELIDVNAFQRWKSLRMLSITNNLIKDLNWIQTELADLWYLDLRGNEIENIPKNLVQFLPSLRVLKLGDNKIRSISYDTIKPFMNLKEFTLGESKVSDKLQPDYFCANQEMKWILDIFSKGSEIPYFFMDSIHHKNCKIGTGIAATYKTCKELKVASEFNCLD